LGLRVQIGLTLFVLLAVTVGLIGIVVLNLMRRSLVLQEGRQTARVSRILVNELSAALSSGATLEGAGQEILSRYFEFGFFDQAELYSESERLFVYPEDGTALSAPDGVGQRSPPGSVQAIPAQFQLIQHEDLGPLVVVEDMIEGDHGYVLRTTRLAAPALVELGSAQLLVSLYVLLATGLAVITGYVLLTWIIVSPIRRIGLAAQRVAEGDRASRVGTRSGNEIGWLAENFNHMLDHLEEGRRTLENRVEDLRRAKSELEEVHEAVIRSERLATIGQLAAGVAHEVGNPLSAVVGLVELLEHDLDADPVERRDMLRRIEAELMRINRTIRDLLDFSRSSDDQEARASLPFVLDSVLKLVSAQPNFRKVDIEVDLSEEVEWIRVGPDHLTQVLLNLLINAADAMGGEGRISVSSELESDGLLVHVLDDGPGLPPERGSLFEPFFTTKGAGEGTGLGLAICDKIAQDAGGYLVAEDGESGGARFSLFLKRAEGTGDES